MTAVPRIAAAQHVAGELLSRAPRLGGTRLLCVDGPAGSGKTTLADAVAAMCRRGGHGVTLVHLDDVYEGWDGLRSVGASVRETIVDPVGAGGIGTFRRFDWVAGRRAEPVAVPASDVLLLEGVGAGDPSYADRTTLLVFVEAPDEVRLRRGLERDGEDLRDRWQRWMEDEQVLLRRHRTRQRADVVVDGLTGRVLDDPG